ncbi:exopolyphosphatase [uncultured Limosilactobacillus sp.]|uniref:exopolyphosphatase n=1 Tax=uncultured Limosilactobacillus sp. TaxID=2837629 RepID=UPI0025F42A10|nr:exopolyphosphatase [uncultured Limosilactobacillus sp.]
MAKGVVGLIFLKPDRLTLRVIDLDQHRIVNEARSGSLHVGQDTVANYPENISAITNNLLGFKRILADYQVTNYHLYGALTDIDLVTGKYVANQIYVRTGLRMHWLNKDQTLANVLAAVNQLVETKKIEKKQLSGYVLNIGLSTSNLAYYKKGKYACSWEIDLGKARLSQLVTNLRQTAATPSDIILDYISSKLEYLVPELKNDDESTMVIQGADTLAERYLSEGQHVEKVPHKEFHKRYQHLLNASDQYIIHHYDVDEQSVNWVLPTYLIVRQIMRLLNVKKVYVTDVTVLDGLEVTRNHPELVLGMVKTAADNLAIRYGADSSHKRFVTSVALKLYDALKPIHRLDDHYRLLLEVACKVDDIGNFINPQGHYRHSAYILEANPLIGLSSQDNEVIAEVSRYHSSETPEVDQPHYMHLDSAIQLPVAQLAAILRVADSLDDSRLQKILQVHLTLVENDLQIQVKTTDDLVLEQWAFERKNQLFTEVYGLHPKLMIVGRE